MRIVLDSVNWTQQEKNLTKAIIVHLLYQNNIVYDAIVVSHPNVDIQNPLGDISFLTTDLVKQSIEAQLLLIEQNRIKAQVEQEARRNELASNELVDIKLADVNSRIDAIVDLASAKVFLKKLCRYLVARGI